MRFGQEDPPEIQAEFQAEFLKAVMAPYGVKMTIVRPGRLGISSNITKAVLEDTMHKVDGFIALASGIRWTSRARKN